MANAVASAAASHVFLCLPQALSGQQMEAVSNAAVDAAKSSGVVQRLVRVGSLGIDSSGPGQGALGDAHVACEVHCRAAGVALSSVRPTSFHTNFVNYDVATLCKEDCLLPEPARERGEGELGPLARTSGGSRLHCCSNPRQTAVMRWSRSLARQNQRCPRLRWQRCSLKSLGGRYVTRRWRLRQCRSTRSFGRSAGGWVWAVD